MSKNNEHKDGNKHLIKFLFGMNSSKQYLKSQINKMSLVVRKPVFSVSDQVRHKPGCTATEDGYMLEIMDFGRIRIVLSV